MSALTQAGLAGLSHAELLSLLPHLVTLLLEAAPPRVRLGVGAWWGRGLSVRGERQGL